MCPRSSARPGHGPAAASSFSIGIFALAFIISTTLDLLARRFGLHEMPHPALAGRWKMPVLKPPKEIVEKEMRRLERLYPVSKYLKRKYKTKRSTPDRINRRETRRMKSEAGKGFSGHAGGYDPSQRILLVGEGNLSFASALCKIFCTGCNNDAKHRCGLNLIATVLEPDERALCNKFPNVKKTLTTLRNFGVNVLFGIDATNLLNYKILWLSTGSFCFCYVYDSLGLVGNS
mmetsp:Transcript_1538/g.3524  ORF Transcript_1538/g.3524 Transcript_1538/m.3524 type:complete len:232 (-) Transcript_1538:731-1426(-)